MLCSLKMNRYWCLCSIAAFSLIACQSHTGVSKDTHELWSVRIFEAGEQKVALAPLSIERDIPVTEAYEIQALYNARMQQAFGEPVGYKVAYASKASQEKWGIEAPTFGTFFEAQGVEPGGSVLADDFILFHIETEVAFVVAEDIREPIDSVDALMPFIESVHVGLDVPDNRFDKRQGAVKVADVIAMSCGTHTYVLGQGVSPKTVSFAGMELSLEHDGQQVYAGAASNVMGDPREAVLILIRHLLDQGSHLRKGDVVLSGAVAGAYTPKSIDARKGRYIGNATGLPSVEFSVE